MAGGGGEHREGLRLRTAEHLLDAAARHAWFVEDEVAGVAELVPAGGTCVDVGAEYGLYTVAMAAAVGRTGTVHAVEPQPGAHRLMAAAVRAVGADDRVVRHRCALAAAPGQASLSVPLRRGLPVHGRAFLTRGAHHGGPNEDDFDRERRIDVVVTTLDELCAAHDVRRLDLLKADVEGAELQVLTGGLGTLRRHRPAVQLEIEAPHLDKYGGTVADVGSLLADLGYAMHAWRDGGWRPVAAVTEARRNYLFVA